MSPELKFSENILLVNDIKSCDYDGVILVTFPREKNIEPPKQVSDFVENACKIDKCAEKEPTLWSCDKVAGNRLVLSPTGKITPYDDARVVYKAAEKGMKRAVKAGVRKPIIIIQKVPFFSDCEHVTILGALESVYSSLQTREMAPEKTDKFEKIGIWSENPDPHVEKIILNAIGLEMSRIVARDIVGSDPERMTSQRVAEYVKEAFKNDANISIKVIDDEALLATEYPLLVAVNRAASHIERHKPRIIQIEYKPPSLEIISETLLLVGKGITYDTGGADIKTGGLMITMSGDKGGAAAVAGFLKACAILKPQHLKVVGVMCMARNSVGADSYVSDEILVSRSGKRVRIGNTDAEGRLAMADALYHMQQRASSEINPHLYTIATLTGHASRSYGKGYTVAMDNYVANKEKHAYKLESSGSSIAEPVEVSILRPEDFFANTNLTDNEDLMQSDFTRRIGKGYRGHQVAGGFLIMAGGLENQDIKYTHLDIAPSSGKYHTGLKATPILVLSHAHKVFQ